MEQPQFQIDHSLSLCLPILYTNDIDKLSDAIETSPFPIDLLRRCPQMHPFEAINLIFKNDFTRKMLSTHLFIAVIFIKEKREDNDGSKLIKDWNPIRP